jgi:hypothetical protein
MLYVSPALALTKKFTKAAANTLKSVVGVPSTPFTVKT